MRASFVPAIFVISAITFAGCSSRAASSKRFVAAGDRYMKTEQWSAASIEYRNAIKRAPGIPDAHVKLAAVAAILHDNQTRATELLWIAKTNPRDVDAQMAAGEACLDAGRLNEAEAPLVRAVALAPRKVGPNRALATLYMQTGRADKAEPYWTFVSTAPDGDPFALADFYAATSRMADAEQELGRLAAIPREQDAALLRLARLFYAHDDAREGDSVLDTLLARDPHDDAAWVLRGQMLLRRGSETAQEAFLNALTEAPESLDALTGLTLADVAAHRTEQAIARIDGRLRDAPDSVPLLILAARTYAGAESFDKAEQVLARVMHLDPANADAQTLLGRVYMGEARPEDARLAFERAASIAPDSVEANTLVAMVLQVRGHWDEARRGYERILAAHPRAAVAANNLAWLDLEEGRLSDALRYGILAHDELRGIPHVEDTLGWIYYMTGHARDALPLLASAVEAQPSNVVYHYHLGMAYWKQDNRPAAREELKRALALSPSFAGHDDAVNVLARLSAK
jgi:tetratricopeptide (TPR) repeat protein